MTRKEILQTAGAALIGAVVVFTWDYITDSVATSEDADIRRIAKSVYVEESATDSGKDLKQVTAAHAIAITELNVTMKHLVTAVEALADD